ncbi:MAG: adenylosuccinate lyase, partial [Azospirillum sp.]|nr:adenylosuccinate lyase [Azospirillum sp.]
ERVKANLDALGGLVHSQRVLLALTQAGVSREDAYRIVQSNAMATWEKGGSFQDRLKADPIVAKKVSPKKIDAMFDMGYHTRHVDTLFKRVFGRKRK